MVNRQNQNQNVVPHAVLDPAQNPASPYYIHSSDNLAATMVNPPLNDKNYNAWARSMKRALVAKNKFRFVSDEISVPTATDANFEAWDRCNSLIHSWILNSVTISIANSIVFLENACDAWRDLRDRFSQGDLVRIFELHNEISNLKQNSMSVSEYYTELKILLEELEHYRPIPQCRCTVPCRCDVIESVKLFREQDNAIRFLLGLNDSFGVVKSPILMSHPLPSLAKVVSLATQHERQTETEEKGDSLTIVNVAEGKKPPYGKGQFGGSSYRNTRKFCTHYYDDVYSQRGVEEPFTAYQYKRIIDMIHHETTASKKGSENGSASEVQTKRRIGLGSLQPDELYHLVVSSSSSTCFSIQHSSISEINDFSHIIPPGALWHFRLVHLSHDRLLALHTVNNSIDVSKSIVCDVCHLAKQKRKMFTVSFSKAQKCFRLVHMDIWGPLAQASVHNHMYFLTILDDCSRFVWVVLLNNKGEVQQQVNNFITLVKTQFGQTVKAIRSDNGPEFLLPAFYSAQGIVHQRSCVSTPQQNGRVERKHQHILNIARALLFQSKLPKKMWCYFVLHVVFLMNRIPSKLLKNKSPYELLYQEAVDLEMMKVFGSLCFANNLANNRSKLDPRARKSIFLGYKQGMKGYVLMDLISQEIFISRDVIFHEHVLPYKGSNSPAWNCLDLQTHGDSTGEKLNVALEI
ncbi:uncharacterized protein LOC130746255 [Lotus japonicus]|uniref:uncharacterized protein LOC130746255 n=1 Tax=Lotus japonicus TaxID=34305 RepID=UPI00258EC7E1|nr:uncharacterized protein LOC130746255 [Lotus japonicus]